MAAKEKATAAGGLGIEAILGQIRPPERQHRLCLRPDLRARWEDLDRQVRMAQREAADSLAGSTGRARELAAECRAVEEEMEASTAVLVLRGMPAKEFSDLLAAHPPRKGKEDEEAFNPDTFGAPLLAGTVAQPEMSVEQAEQLIGKITNGQWNELFNACWMINRGTVDVPFSQAASAHLASTATS